MYCSYELRKNSTNFMFFKKKTKFKYPKLLYTFSNYIKVKERQILTG